MDIEEYAKRYSKELINLISSIPYSDLKKISTILEIAWHNNKKIFLIGNGGSASTASHIACDLSKSTIKSNTPRLKVIALTDSISLITAWANDTSYENIFCEQLQNILEKNDIVIAFSGSGNSPNILKAIRIANEMGGITIGLSGYKGGKLKNIANYNIVINSNNMQQIEDLHLMVGHLIFSFIRDNIIK
jgi:D-sedoheptulose 7-phosphate isomerase